MTRARPAHLLAILLPLLSCTSPSEPATATGDTTAGTLGDSSEGSAPTSTPASSTGDGGDSTTTTSAGADTMTGSEDPTSSSDGGDTGLGISPGCGSDPSTVLGGTVDVAGTARQYLLLLPPGYDRDTPYPIVFGWHGLGGTSESARAIYQLEDFWPEPVVVVYPQGLPQVGNDSGWDLGANGEDMAFFDAMANAFSQELCLDLDRIYAMGFSFGGYMSNHLACYRGDYIRGFVAVGGGGPFASDTCQSPVPAMIIHGTTDDVVPLGEGEDSRDKWIATNGCGTRTSTYMIGKETTCEEYQGCDAAAPTTWCTHWSGHTWRDWMNTTIPEFLVGVP